MKTLRKCTLDKNALLFGPWTTEADFVQWTSVDLHCAIKRSSMLFSLCGYVAVEQQHWAYGKEIDHLYVHGGITFNNYNVDCEIFELDSEDPTDLWIFGFDASHFNDIVPGMISWRPKQVLPSFIDTATYKDLHFMMEECENLVSQLNTK